MNNKIKEFREAKNMTQEELALKSGVSRTIISGLESGRTSVTTTLTLKKIAETLERSISDIFFDDKV